MHILIIMKLPDSEECVVSVYINRTILFVTSCIISNFICHVLDNNLSRKLCQWIILIFSGQVVVSVEDSMLPLYITDIIRESAYRK
jgi:hypothetical protein